MEDYTATVKLRPDFAPAYYNRALSRLFRNDPAQPDNQRALADLDEALRLDPDMVLAYVDRAGARQRLKDPRGAIADLTLALERRPDLTQAYFMRAQSRRDPRINDLEGAARDESEGLRRPPDGEAPDRLVAPQTGRGIGRDHRRVERCRQHD